MKTTTEQKHTQTLRYNGVVPIHAPRALGVGQIAEVLTEDGEYWLDVYAPDFKAAQERAAFIVRACNENAQLHELVNANVIARCDAQDRADKLAVALEELVNAVFGMGYDTVPVIQESHAKARAAIHRATGGQP